jgi:uncharacterized protein (UPF0147 family)
MSKRELTNEQQAISQLYSVLVAIVASDRTPKRTAEATIQTLEKLFNDENGPFQSTDELIGMTMAMGEAMNDVVRDRNKHIERAAEGANMLNQWGLN